MRNTAAHPFTPAEAAETVLRTTAIIGLLADAVAIVGLVILYSAFLDRPNASAWYQAVPPWLVIGGTLFLAFVLLRQAGLHRWACHVGAALSWPVAAFAIAAIGMDFGIAGLGLIAVTIVVAFLMTWACASDWDRLRRGV